MKPRRAHPPAHPPRLALRHVVAASEEGCRLDELLAARLSARLPRPPSKAALRRMIMAGAVRVDGRALRRPGFVLSQGARVSADVDAARLQRPAGSDEAFTLDRARVLYEDAWLIAVDKPAGLPMHATADPRRAHLVGAVKAYLARARGAGAEPYLGVHQRLDRDTSGVVLFTKDPAANAGLAEQFERHALEKVYLALTGRPARQAPRAWSMSDPLGRVGRGRVGRVPTDEGGRGARTDFRVLGARPDVLVLEARPRTGRQHQIRAHLAAGGLPILGDVLYGGDARAAPRPMLHAARLRLRHPVTQAELSIECPPPADFAAVLGAPAAPSKTKAPPRARASRARR